MKWICFRLYQIVPRQKQRMQAVDVVEMDAYIAEIFLDVPSFVGMAL